MTRKKAAPRAASKKPKPKPNIRKCDACHATKLAAAFQPEHSVCRDCENLDSAQREWLSAIRPAKVLLIDIETAPTLGWAWRNWDTSLIATKAEWFILSYAFKWFGGDNKTKVVALPDFPECYAANNEDDSRLVGELWKLLDEADFIVGHNLDRFDLRKINARAIIAGLPPPSPFKSIDTLKVARKHFAFSSNKLNDLGVVLGLGEKLQHSGAKLWLDVMAGNKKAWVEMRAYNRQDVDLLEAVYLKLRPWHATHPSFDHFSRAGACPVCQSGRVQRRGWRRTKTSMRQQYCCVGCGHFFTDQKAIKVVA